MTYNLELIENIDRQIVDRKELSIPIVNMYVDKLC